ncbi:MAG: hypothetical protein IPF78_03735 [Flavobacteriales bacterium]|nr:hypothetical protein [Flavobacteriales bacterium]
MTTTTGVAGLRPLLVYLDNDGTPVERYTYAPGTPANWSAGNVAEFISIDVQGTDLFITGYSLGSGIPAQAFGMLLHAGTDRFNFPWRHFTADLGDPICNIGLHNPNSTYYTNNSTGGGFVPETGGVHIVWPTMGNFSEGSVYGGSANVATLLVHGLDLDGTLLWTTDLGEVRAYDLQSDMTPTADGKVALVSTKLSGADLTLPSLPISWDDFSPSQKACLNGTFGFANPDLPNTTENEAAGVNWDYDGSTNPESGNDPTGLYHYWNTYAYVAKLDPETGNLIWQTQFDAHPACPVRALTPTCASRSACTRSPRPMTVASWSAATPATISMISIWPSSMTARPGSTMPEAPRSTPTTNTTSPPLPRGVRT